MENDKFEKPGKKMTPEEKLFKVIATGGRDPSFDDAKQPPEFMDQDPFSKIENFFKKIGRIFEDRLGDKIKTGWTKPQWAAGTAWGGNLAHVVRLKNVNRGLMAAVGILGFYLVFDFLFGTGYGGISFNDLAEKKSGGRAAGLQTPELLSPDLSHYLSPAGNRNVFLPHPPSSAAGGQAPAGVGAPPNVNLKLVGISWDEREFVAMIELENEKGAHFVRKGDVLQNGVTIENITEYAVSVSLGNRKWDLS